MKHDTHLAVRLTEPVVFLRGGTDYSTNSRRSNRRSSAASRAQQQQPPQPPQEQDPAIFMAAPVSVDRASPRPQDSNQERTNGVLNMPTEEEGPPAMLRGLVTLTLSKPTRIRKIEAKLKGYTRSEWPEGIGARRIDVADTRELIEETFTFFNASDASNRTSRDRRAWSVSPDRRESRFDRAPGRQAASRAISAFPARETSLGPGLYSSRDGYMASVSSGINSSSTPPPLSRVASGSGADPPSPAPFRPSRLSSVSPSPATTRQSSPRMSRSNSASTSTHSHFTTINEMTPSSTEIPSYEAAVNPPPPLERSGTNSTLDDEADGTQSAPVASSVQSSFEYLPLGSLETLPTEPPSRRGSRPSFSSRSASRPSLSPPASLNDPRQRSETPRTRKVRLSSSRSRFSLSQLSDTIRGKSKSRRSLTPDRRCDSVDEPNATPGPNIRSGSRGRHKGLKALREALTVGVHDAQHRNGLEDSDEEDDGFGKELRWREFKPGTYTWALLVPLSVRLPPSLECGFGVNTYRLKATVKRPGALTSKITAETPLELVAAPGDDDMEESENIIVDRMWETHLHYVIVFNQKSFPIGGTIPISIRLRPLGKIRVYRITITLEEKTIYYAHERHVQRSEAVRRFPLARINYDKDEQPILPITSDSPTAIQDSPLASWLSDPDAISDAVASPFELMGPWDLECAVPAPPTESGVNFSTTNPESNISIQHHIKVVIRVDKDSPEDVDAKGVRKKWDIIVEARMHVLSHRCSDHGALPPYSGDTPPVALPRPNRRSQSPYVGRSKVRHDEGSGFDPQAALAFAPQAEAGPSTVGTIMPFAPAPQDPDAPAPPSYEAYEEEVRGRSPVRWDGSR